MSESSEWEMGAVASTNPDAMMSGFSAKDVTKAVRQLRSIKGSYSDKMQIIWSNAPKCKSCGFRPRWSESQNAVLMCECQYTMLKAHAAHQQVSTFTAPMDGVEIIVVPSTIRKGE